MQSLRNSITRSHYNSDVLLTLTKRRFYLVNTRMRSKRDIKMGWLCTRGSGGRGAVLGIVGGGVTFRFLNGDAIPDENMPFFVCYTLSWFS